MPNAHPSFGAVPLMRSGSFRTKGVGAPYPNVWSLKSHSYTHETKHQPAFTSIITSTNNHYPRFFFPPNSYSHVSHPWPQLPGTKWMAMRATGPATMALDSNARASTAAPPLCGRGSTWRQPAAHRWKVLSWMMKVGEGRKRWRLPSGKLT